MRRRAESGGQPLCSAIANETGLALRLVFHQPLRQTEGLLRSIADVLGGDIAIPDHATLIRRGGGLTILLRRLDRAEPLHLLVDSTGLKIYGEGEWLDQKHGIRSRRRWRKLHLGIDAVTDEIVASELTPYDVGDVSEIPALLDQIDAEVASMTADGACDGEAVYDAVAGRHPEAAVIIPPRATAVSNESTTTQRDRHIAAIEEHRAWVGSVVQATIAEAWSKPQCIATRPLSAGGETRGLCPISGPRQKLVATCSTE
jgi:hypothetical protein